MGSSKTGSLVNHPPHYNRGRFEVIDVIEDWGCDFQWYLERKIQQVKNQKS